MNTQWLDFPPDRPLPGLDQAIDFVNTTGLSKGKPFDDLPTVQAALTWLGSTGYLAHVDVAAELARLNPDGSAGRRALARLRAVRAGLRDLFDAAAEERAPSDAAIAAVNEALAMPETVRLVRTGLGIRLAQKREGKPFDQALASIARAVGDELGSGHAERFRICENDTCRWAFYDRSRPGTRRWCEMSSCGNRMKAARHRAKHKSRGNGLTRGSSPGRPPTRRSDRRASRGPGRYRTTMLTRRPPPAWMTRSGFRPASSS